MTPPPVWNAMIEKRPALIARCQSTSDVASILAYARNEGLEVAVRGGGHSVSGLSFTDGA
jgi:FAD/FMN-containing dehydrogenase